MGVGLCPGPKGEELPEAEVVGVCGVGIRIFAWASFVKLAW